jgi:pilus assembly protein CpaC
MKLSSTACEHARAGWRRFGLLALTLGVLSAQPAQAGNPKIRVTVGQSVTQYSASPIKTLSLADSKIADVVVANTHEILVNGKAIGYTTVVVWDENNRSTIYDVVVRGPFSDEQIELQVKVAEINRTKAAEFGIDLLYQNRQGTAGSFAGGVATPSVPLEIFQGGSATENVTMALRYATGSFQLQAMVHALEEHGVLKVLAQPNVVAMSGQSADFLSGGEIPVPIATAGAQGGSTITIEWKEFGVKVRFLPTIVDSGVVNLMVAPEVSSIDFANGIVLSGFRVPALRTRRASTTVELKDGESW